MTRRHSPAEAQFWYLAGKTLLESLDPTCKVLDVGSCSRSKHARRHITQGAHALCGEHLHITVTGLRGPQLDANNHRWDGVPNCERCLRIADFIVTSQIMMRAPTYASPA